MVQIDWMTQQSPVHSPTACCPMEIKLPQSLWRALPKISQTARPPRPEPSEERSGDFAICARTISMSGGVSRLPRKKD